MSFQSGHFKLSIRTACENKFIMQQCNTLYIYVMNISRYKQRPVFLFYFNHFECSNRVLRMAILMEQLFLSTHCVLTSENTENNLEISESRISCDAVRFRVFAAFRQLSVLCKFAVSSKFRNFLLNWNFWNIQPSHVVPGNLRPVVPPEEDESPTNATQNVPQRPTLVQNLGTRLLAGDFNPTSMVDNFNFGQLYPNAIGRSIRRTLRNRRRRNNQADNMKVALVVVGFLILDYFLPRHWRQSFSSLPCFIKNCDRNPIKVANPRKIFNLPILPSSRRVTWLLRTRETGHHTSSTSCGSLAFSDRGLKSIPDCLGSFRTIRASCRLRARKIRSRSLWLTPGALCWDLKMFECYQWHRILCNISYVFAVGGIRFHAASSSFDRVHRGLPSTTAKSRRDPCECKTTVGVLELWWAWCHRSCSSLDPGMTSASSRAETLRNLCQAGTFRSREFPTATILVVTILARPCLDAKVATSSRQLNRSRPKQISGFRSRCVAWTWKCRRQVGRSSNREVTSCMKPCTWPSFELGGSSGLRVGTKRRDRREKPSASPPCTRRETPTRSAAPDPRAQPQCAGQLGFGRWRYQS